MKKIAIVFFLLAGCSSSTSSTPNQTPDQTGDTGSTEETAPAFDVAQTLEKNLTGFFDSADQAKTNASYFEIHLAICKVDAPELGPRVLYVEQAMADSLDAPYRQRLYVVEAKSDKVGVSRVFELHKPKAMIGTCKKDALVHLAAADAFERAGCAVELAWDGAKFTGGTHGKDCPSDLHGASYATSEVELDQQGLRSWDRGFDATDKQVWGAVKGPYVFVRR